MRASCNSRRTVEATQGLRVNDTMNQRCGASLGGRKQRKQRPNQLTARHQLDHGHDLRRQRHLREAQLARNLAHLCANKSGQMAQPKRTQRCRKMLGLNHAASRPNCDGAHKRVLTAISCSANVYECASATARLRTPVANTAFRSLHASREVRSQLSRADRGNGG